jgi:hypothetical protein
MAAHVPISPSSGLEGSAWRSFGILPALRASKPAWTACRKALAIRTGSRDLAIAELTSTALQASSMASAASDAVPSPASSTTGTGLRRQISSIMAGLQMPRPEPIGAPSGITVAQPRSASFRHVTRSSLQYGRTMKPFPTSSPGRLQELLDVRVERLALANHFELDPIGLERLPGQLGGQHGIACGRAARCVGQKSVTLAEQIDQALRVAREVDAADRGGHQLSAARLDRIQQDLLVGIARRSDD